MRTIQDPFKEWLKANWTELISTYVASGAQPGLNMTFDAYAEMKFMERKEQLPFQIGPDWEAVEPTPL